MRKLVPFLLNIPALFLYLFTFSSCEEENAQRTITLTLAQPQFDLLARRYVLISDREGNTLDYEILTEGTIELQIPAHVTDETFTLSFLVPVPNRLLLSPDHDIISFAGIAPGAYTFSRKSTIGQIGAATVTLENISPSVDISFGGQGYYTGRNGNVFSLGVMMRDGVEPRTLISGIDNTTGEGRAHIANIPNQAALTLDYNTFITMTSTNIVLSGDSCLVRQFAIADEYEYGMGSRKPALSSKPTEVPLYASPDFDSYVTTINLYKGSETYEGTFYGSILPNSFELLEGEIEITRNDGLAFGTNVTGVADLLRVTFATEIDNRWGPKTTLRRTYFMPFGSTASIQHPRIPMKILQAESSADMPNGELESVSLIDFKDFESYDEFVNYRLNEDFELPIRSDSKTKTVRYKE